MTIVQIPSQQQELFDTQGKKKTFCPQVQWRLLVIFYNIPLPTKEEEKSREN